MTLIIRDQLLNPPTWLASFRDLTLYCHIFLRIDCVIESDAIDLYYFWTKPRGALDFVEEFVRPGSEDGLRIDVRHNYPRTIVADRIIPENMSRLISSVRWLNSL